MGKGYVMTVLLLAGCAGQPPEQPPVATRMVVVVPGAPAAATAPAAAPATEPSLATGDTHTVKVDASNVVAVQKAGYKLVTKDGVPLYCRTDTVTGSRLVSRTTCLTEQELTAQMDATRQSMEHIGAHQTGPTGH